MPYALTINADVTEITRLKNLLSHIPNAYNKAAKKAASETLKALKLTASEEASKVYAMSPAEIRKAIKLYPSSGTLKVTGRRKNLTDYRITPKKPGIRKLMRGAVMRQGGLKAIPRGFLIHGRNSGKIIAMLRTGSKPQDIESLTSPAVPQMMENEQVNQAISGMAESDVMKRLRLYVWQAVTEGR